jgi:hypothetical protein
MSFRRIRYDPEERHFLIDGGGEIYVTNKFLILSGPQEWLAPVGLASLATALREADSDETNRLFVSTDPPARFDDRYPNHLMDIQLERTADPQRMGVSLSIERTWEDDEDEVRQEITRLMAPLVTRHRGTGLRVKRNEDMEAWFEVAFDITTRNKTVADGLRVGEEMQALINAVSGGTLTLLSAADLVRSGHAATLIEQQEGPWFDAKGAPYALKTDANKWELAKDVASFANSEHGGLILLGARTKPGRDGDVVQAVTDFDLKLVDAAAYRRILTSRVHPRVEGLEVRTIPTSRGRGIGYLFIPPQREEIKPFIVRGVVIEQGMRTVHVSIPTRDGEDTRYADPAEIHGLLQAGRAALRQSR